MDRNHIMGLSEEDLLGLVNKNFATRIQGLKDENLHEAWEVVNKLAENAWGIDIRVTNEFINVDGYKFYRGPGTIFAQYGLRPDFASIVEGICRTGLVNLFETGELRE